MVVVIYIKDIKVLDSRCNFLLIVILTFADHFHQDEFIKLNRLARYQLSKHVMVENFIQRQKIKQ